ncbi:U-box domain-containing protein 4 isoform X1 [Ananas comosus]|nr:U-box domain-containing protein 4 isoform X1 [Ananas comosus]
MHFETGPMEIPLLKTLLDSISNFALLSSSNAVKTELVHRYWRKIKEILDLLKPVFDDVICKASLDEQLSNVLKELDFVINEAQEIIGSWNQMSSKILLVLQIEPIITKIKTYALEICLNVNSSVPPPVPSCSSTCIEKLQRMHNDQICGVIKEAAKELVGKATPKPEKLAKISNHFSLSTNHELLIEAVALEKLKTKGGRGENHIEFDTIDRVTALVNHMHDCFVKEKQLLSIKGIPIPADFCCPLSLELMSDPVIVASGQTYERAFIKKWLDLGLTVCPKTRQTLVHTNLIPNYTVKALIANWCESNDIKLPDPVKSLNLSLPSAFLVDSSPNERADCPSSPESNSPTSPHQRLSISQTSNGCEENFSSLSLATSEAKTESSLEQSRCTDSRGETSNQLKEESFRASHVDMQIQGQNSSASASSAVPSSNAVPVSSEGSSNDSSDTSGEVSQETQNVSSAPPREPEFPLRRSQIWRRPSDRFSPRIVSSQMDSRPDLSGVETEVRKLIEDLKNDSVEVQRAATAELRLLAKHNMENRIVIANCGAVSPLVGLLYSADPKTQENAVTALLNLSINDNNKTAIASADAIDPLIHVLKTGSPEAKENSAATLFSLSVIEENKVRIGRSGAIVPLVELLGNGTPRGRKDAATALFNLSIFHENKARIVQAGAVKHLVELMDPAAGMVDKAVAVLANLATIPEGRTAIGHAGGIPVLVEVVELGSARGKENAAAALLHLCTNSNRFCSQVLQEGAVPPLVVLSQSGTARAKEKAHALLSYFRNQRHGSAGRGRS